MGGAVSIYGLCLRVGVGQDAGLEFGLVVTLGIGGWC